ncbi:MFS transporter [Poseidonocella sedimentorum]|uniref:Cyanate permease n=1 Tax=Poseidonocella sedimentorum TaxID=871652 RepID=A0A1I6E3B0_9RHOB|nr:MFS transporter [Poseidonocella sedimentorum]SFR12260.1 Cyanate permease [Poseidonocella sedimentorum]
MTTVDPSLHATTTPKRKPDGPGLYGALSLTTLSQIAATSSVLALTTIPTIVADALGIAPYLIGYQVSLIYASGVFFSMLASGMVKRLGAGRVGQLAIVAAGVGFLLMATGTLAGIAAGSVLIGVGYALNNPSSSHILTKLAPRARRNLIFSIKQAGVPLGGMMAALAIPPLAQRFGWQVTLMLFALFPLALAAMYQWVGAAWNRERVRGVPVTRGIWAGQRAVWRDPNLRALAVIGFLFSGVQLSISTFVVTMLIQQFGWSPLTAASVAAVLQGFGAVGRVFWGFMADWLNSGFLVLAIIGGLTGLCAVSFAVFGWLPALGLGVVVISGLAGSGWNGVLLAETASASPGAGTLTGEVLTYTFVGVMVGPAAFATVYALLGSFTLTFSLFSTLAFLGGALAFLRYWKCRP